jgi:hypothetical protein
MKILILISALFFCLSSFNTHLGDYKSIVNIHSFLKGEVLTYRLHYGVFTAGEASVWVNPEIKKVRGKDCYSFNIKGKTTGAFAAVMTIEDEWKSYVDTCSMSPVQFSREIIENSYYLKERVDFDRNNANVTWEKRDRVQKHENFEVPTNVHDIVSAYYFLRNIDYSKMKIGQRTSVKAFFEDKLYDFEVEYMGKDIVKTKLGKVNAIRLIPIMPDNELFEGNDAIQFWLSDDKNKIPLKVKAKMFVGAVEVDIKDYTGLRYQLNIEK